MAVVSVVMCSIDPGRFARASASYRRALGDIEHEIVGIHDARSLAEGYNRAIDRARGDVLVFSHDDVEILSRDFATRLLAHLERNDIVGIAGTTRLVGGAWNMAGHPFDAMLVASPRPDDGKLVLLVMGGRPLVVTGAQALDGVFMAVRAPVARELRFDEATFDHFHLYDLDFTFRGFLAGRRLAICRDLVIVHHSQGTYDAAWDEQRLRFERKFEGRLARPLPKRLPSVLNVPLDNAAIADPIRLAEATHPATLERYVASIDRTAPI